MELVWVGVPLDAADAQSVVFVLVGLLEVADREDFYEGVHAAQREELVIVGEGHVDHIVFVDF